MEWLKKLTDFIMPDPEGEEESEKVDAKHEEASAKDSGKIETIAKSPAVVANEVQTTAETVGAVKAVSGGAGFGFGSPAKFNSEPVTRPPLTVIENRIKELNVKVYTPTKFDQAEIIAGDILGKNAAVVNYEYVESALQLRICDFLNGVCYVTDGYTDKISEKIFLYIPDGVETSDIAEAVSALNNNGQQYRRGMFAN